MHRPLALTALCLATAALTPSAARPCSVAEGPTAIEFPFEGATTHSRPTFFMPVGGGLKLTDGDGVEVALERDERYASTFMRTTLTVAMRPVAPLPGGRYRLDGAAMVMSFEAQVSFFVDPTLDETRPPLNDVVATATLDEPDEGGCDGFMSCGDFDRTRLVVSVPEGDDVRALRLTMRNPATNLRRIELVAVDEFAAGGRRQVSISDNAQRWPGSLKRDRLCVEVEPLTESGAWGPAFDLGCFDPRGDDPRVIDTRSGCSTGGVNANTLGLWCLLFVWARSRLRAGRAAAR